MSRPHSRNGISASSTSNSNSNTHRSTTASERTERPRTSGMLVVDEFGNTFNPEDLRPATFKTTLKHLQGKNSSSSGTTAKQQTRPKQRPSSSVGLTRAASHKLLQQKKFVSPAMMRTSMVNSRSGYLFGDLVNNTVRYKNPKDTEMGGFVQSASAYSKMLERDQRNDAVPFAYAPRFDWTTTISNHSPGPIYFANNLVTKQQQPKFSFGGGREGRASFAFGSIEKGLFYPGSSEKQSTSDMVSPASYNPHESVNARIPRPASANWSSSRTKRFFKVRSDLELVPGPKYFSNFRKEKNTSVSFGPKPRPRKQRTVTPTGGTKFNVPSMLLRKKKHQYQRGSFESSMEASSSSSSSSSGRKKRSHSSSGDDSDSSSSSRRPSSSSASSSQKPKRVGSLAQVYIKPKEVREIERILKRTTFSQRLPLSAWHGKRMAKHQVGKNSPGPIYMVPTENWKCKQPPPKRTYEGNVVPSWR